MRPFLSTASFAYNFDLLAMTRDQHEAALRLARAGSVASQGDSALFAVRAAEEARLHFAAGNFASAIGCIDGAFLALRGRTPEPGTAEAGIWRDRALYHYVVGNEATAHSTWESLNNPAEIYLQKEGKVGLELLQLGVYAASEFGCQPAEALRYVRHLNYRLRSVRPIGHETYEASLLTVVLEILNGQYAVARRDGLRMLEVISEPYPEARLCHLLVTTALAWAEVGLDRFSDAAARLSDALADLTPEDSWAASVIGYAQFLGGFAAANTPAGCAREVLLSSRLRAVTTLGPGSPGAHNIDSAYLQLASADEHAPEALDEVSSVALSFISSEATDCGIRSQWQIYAAELYVSLLLQNRLESLGRAVELSIALQDLIRRRMAEKSPVFVESCLLLGSACFTLSLNEPTTDHISATLRVLWRTHEMAEKEFGVEHPATREAAAALVGVLVTYLRAQMVKETFGAEVDEICEKYSLVRKQTELTEDYNDVTKGDLAWMLATAVYEDWRGSNGGEAGGVVEVLQLSIATFGETGLYTRSLRTGIERLEMGGPVL